MANREGEGGQVSPIVRHDEPSAFRLPEGEMCVEEISAHIEQYLAPVGGVFHEILSDTVHVDVHIVPATDRHPFLQLVTSGMSDLPMSTPEDADVPRFAEVMITLPADWKLDEESMNSEEWYWPVRLLKTLARLPHKYATWLGIGHTMPNGDPAEPYAANTKLCGAMIVPAVTAPAGFETLHIDDDKTIHFFSVMPLYEAEMDFKLRKGADALLERFSAKGIGDRVDLARVDVARKRFGFF